MHPIFEKKFNPKKGIDLKRYPDAKDEAHTVMGEEQGACLDWMGRVCSARRTPIKKNPDGSELHCDVGGVQSKPDPKKGKSPTPKKGSSWFFFRIIDSILT